MKLKHCNKCGETKDESEFRNDKTKKDGKSTTCKKCKGVVEKQWRDNNADYVKEYHKQYRADNFEYRQELHKRWREENPEKLKELRRKYYQDNKEYLSEQHKHYREVNKERTDFLRKRWRQRNREYFNEYQRKRYSEDINYKLKCRMYSFLHRTLGHERTDHSYEELGYTTEQLKKRIECQFENEMCWENYGEWHIDRKIPMQWFLNKGETRPHIINALSNLQPMWASENCSKQDKWTGVNNERT